MTTLEGLRREILHNPDEDTIRLAYADALDESGKPHNLARAEFIRLQIALHHAAPDEDFDKSCRQNTILKTWALRWLPKPLRKPVATIYGICSPCVGYDLDSIAQFQRGFISHLQFTYRPLLDPLDDEKMVLDFARGVRAVFASNPLQAVTVSLGHGFDFTTVITRFPTHWEMGFDDDTSHKHLARLAGHPKRGANPRSFLGRDMVLWFMNTIIPLRSLAQTMNLNNDPLPF